jgi:hypothetical protein
VVDVSLINHENVVVWSLDIGMFVDVCGLLLLPLCTKGRSWVVPVGLPIWEPSLLLSE